MKAPSMWADVKTGKEGRRSCALRVGAAERRHTVRLAGVNYRVCSSFQEWREDQPPMALPPALS